MFNTHICKECLNTYTGKPDNCPHCGHVLRTKKLTKEEKAKIKKEKRAKKHKITNQEIMDSLDFVELSKKAKKNNSQGVIKKKDVTPEFEVDKNGEYNINIKDVSYMPETYEYSVKKARGEHVQEKIQWWEVYKWADLMLVRRKIKKQVKKASHYKPEQIKKPSMIAYCLFLGWMGAHNFYARNYRKGIFVLLSVIIGSFVVLAPYSFLEYIKVSVGGGLLFIVLFLWVLDFINICTNKYSYRLCKWKFIDCLNLKTRAILGKKYINKEEYKKPWYVRLVNKIAEKSKDRKVKKQQLKQQNAEQSLDENKEAENTQKDNK